MILYHIRTLLTLAAIGAALLLFFRIPQPRSRLFRLVGVLCTAALAVELYGYATALPHQLNVLAYNAFILLEFVLVLVMVRVQQSGWKWVLLAVALIGISGFALNAFHVDPRKDMLFEGAVWLAFLLASVLCALLWRMANNSTEALHMVPAFWLFTGMLLYFIALPPIVGLARYLRTLDLEMASTLWTIMPLLCMLRYLLAAYACWLQRGRQRPEHE